MQQPPPHQQRRQQMEPFQIEEPQHPSRDTSPTGFEFDHPLSEVWRSLFQQLDVDRDGRIPTHELLGRLQANAARFGMTAAQMRALVRWADKNQDNWINFPEFCILMAEIKHLRAKYAMLRAAQMVVPEKQRPEKFSYIEQYNCMPPPLFMILITLIEIGFYIYYAVTDEKHPGISVSGPVPVYSWAIYNPERKREVWRFLSYMLIHIGIYHITFNCLTQIVLGVSLELVHKPHRICAVYMAGVLYGSLAVAIVDPTVYLAGASGGVYALIAAHVANLVVNWNEMEFAPCRLVFMTIMIGADVGLALYNRFGNPSAAGGNQVSYVAHIGGFIAGLFMGVIVLRNFKLHTWERVVWWMALVGFITLLVAMVVYIIVTSSV